MNVNEIYEGINKRMFEGKIFWTRKVLNNTKGDDPFLSLCRQYYNAAYFMGGKLARKFLYKKEEGNHYFQFVGLSFPFPETINDFKILMTEAPDLLFPLKFGKDSFDYSEIEKCFGDGPYEINKNVCLNPGDVVIDCGANMGLFSNVALAKECEVYAFEPSKAMCERYLSKYDNNALHIEEYALTDTDIGEEMFVEEENHEGKSHIANIDKKGEGYCVLETQSQREQSTNAHQYKVKVTTLDDWAAKNQISKIDFIKADIEGAERLMLKGAQHILQTCEPKLSICTYHFEDDPIVLERIIRQANPNYFIEHKYKKLYAYVPKER